MTDGVLSIEAKRSEEKTEEKGRYLRREVFSGNYRRQLTLPREVKAEDIKARFENGTLVPNTGTYVTVSRGLFFKISYLHRF